MVRTSWVYQLKKDDLTTYLREFKLDTEGTVEELRKRFTQFITEHGKLHEVRLSELEVRHMRSVSPAKVEVVQPVEDNSENKVSEQPTMMKPSTSTTAPSNKLAEDQLLTPYYTAEPSRRNSVQEETFQPPSNMPNQYLPETDARPLSAVSYTVIMDKVRKWSERFDGYKCPISFIDRIEELANVYDLPLDWMPRTMPELLRDRALLWHRNNKKQWQSWQTFRDDFLRFFLPPRYFEHLEDRIRGRYQQPRETFNDYVLSMLDLMRPAGYSSIQKLERIFRNSRQEFQLHIKRREFESLDDLMLLAGDYEEVTRQVPPVSTRPSVERNRQMSNKTSAPVNSNNRIDVRTACRRCGQNGHFSRGCRNPVQLFCWNCGQMNVRTLDCCGRTAGNARGDHEVRATVGSQPPPARNH